MLDQWDAHFAIRLNDNNEAELMSEDESEKSMAAEDKAKMRTMFDAVGRLYFSIE